MALRNAATSKVLAASFGLFAGYSAYRYRASRSTLQQDAASPSASTSGTYLALLTASLEWFIYNAEPRVLTTRATRHHGCQTQFPGMPSAFCKVFLLLFETKKWLPEETCTGHGAFERLMKHWANRPSSPSRYPATAASSPFQTLSTS